MWLWKPQKLAFSICFQWLIRGLHQFVQALKILFFYSESNHSDWRTERSLHELTSPGQWENGLCYQAGTLYMVVFVCVRVCTVLRVCVHTYACEAEVIRSRSLCFFPHAHAQGRSSCTKPEQHKSVFRAVK